jgi:hypothetical protein
MPFLLSGRNRILKYVIQSIKKPTFFFELAYKYPIEFSQINIHSSNDK